jgi:repressor of nif and glnA expression
MRGRAPSHDFVEPMILKILKESRVSMSALAINYMVNEAARRTINLNAIRNHLTLLVKNKKIFESLDKENDVIYYKLITI